MNRKIWILLVLAFGTVATWALFATRHEILAEERAVVCLNKPKQSGTEATDAMRRQMSALGYGGNELLPALASLRPAPADAAKPEPKQEPSALPLQGPTSTPQQYLIRNARVVLEVDDVRSREAAIANAVTLAKGYISNLNDSTSPLGEALISMEIRIPATELEGVLSELDGWGKVLAREVTAQDVSQEYTDTDSRSRNLKKTEERLLEHLSRSAALENTIKLEGELTRVREMIEVFEGRLRYLDNRVGYSTLQLTLKPTPTAQPITPPDTFSTAREFTQATREVVAFAQYIWARAIWIAVWSPVWLPMALFTIWSALRIARSGVLGHSFRLTP